jgi:redox-regulated HSP33 family molecular chaperone
MLFFAEPLAQISANSTVKNHIRAYLTHETREFEALIPQRAITVGSWTGQGWVVSEPPPVALDI